MQKGQVVNLIRLDFGLPNLISTWMNHDGQTHQGEFLLSIEELQLG
jgi:hypothetical protein